MTAIEKLYSLQKFGIKLGLENIQNLLQILGNPHHKFRSFHIAGTNGKGSTSSFIASILQENGLKIGLYTSPHFVRFNERIRINGAEIQDDYIEEFVSGLDEILNEMRPTFFEVTTALVFKYFADMKIDFGVIETGLGGRLDATNVLSPIAAIITSISLEHTDILGNSIEQITSEKAGIIKEGIKVFVGRIPEQSIKIIEDTCREKESELYKLSDVYAEGEQKIGSGIGEIIINPGLKGKYQLYNAALAAYTVAETLQISNVDCYERGMKNVIKNSGIQGRYEVVHQHPKIIFDSAHNIEGISSFLEAFQEEEALYEKRIAIFGVMKDKSIKKMLQLLMPHFDEFYFTSIDMERCEDKYDLMIVGKELNLKCFVVDDIIKLINDFITQNKNQCMVALGSMYVLGDIKTRLLKKKLDIIFN